MTIDFDRRVYQFLALAAVVMISIGTVFYHIVEKFSWVDAYYFSVVTLATVGYGDYVPKTTIGKLFTTVYIFFGVGIIATFFSYKLRRRAAHIQDNASRRKSKKIT